MELSIHIWWSEYQIIGDDPYQSVQSFCAFFCPEEWFILFCKFEDLPCDIREVWDEGALISYDSHGALHFPNVLQFSRPVLESLYLGWIRPDRPPFDDPSQKVHSLLQEMALGQFQEV